MAIKMIGVQTLEKVYSLSSTQSSNTMEFVMKIAKGNEELGILVASDNRQRYLFEDLIDILKYVQEEHKHSFTFSFRKQEIKFNPNDDVEEKLQEMLLV